MENTIDNARQFLIDSGRRELENIGYGMTGDEIKKWVWNGIPLPDSLDEVCVLLKEFQSYLLSRVEDRREIPTTRGEKHLFIMANILRLGIDRDGYKELILDLTERLEDKPVTLGKNSCLLDYTFPGGRFYNEDKGKREETKPSREELIKFCKFVLPTIDLFVKDAYDKLVDQYLNKRDNPVEGKQ